MGSYQLSKLTPQHVQEFIAAELAEGFAPKTVRDAYAVLRQALSQAAKWDLVSRNVAALVDPPKVERHEPQTLTPDEARALLKAVRGDRLEALYVLAVHCGLREGEVLGLHWGDVDLQAGTARIRVALQRFGGKLRLVEPRTNQSRRNVILPSPVVATLRQHRKRQLEEQVKAGSEWIETGLVFTSELGTPIDPRNLIRHWHRIRQRIGRPDLRFHDLRHACATLYLALGTHPRVVQELLGHSTISMTMDTYSHSVPVLHRDAAERLARLLGGVG